MKISDLVRIPILEVFIGFVIYYVLMQFPEFIKFISSIIFIPEMTWVEYLKIFGLPFTILTINYKYGDDILNPSDKENRKILKEFPSYSMLKNRVWYSIIVSLFVIVGTIYCWYQAMKNSNDIEFYTIIILVLWSISVMTFLSMARAKLDIKDILY